MNPKILVVGSSNTDMVLRLPRLPRPGETLLGGEFQSVAGGKGANQAVAAARAGGSVTFLARIGEDALGETALAGFRSDDIDVSQVIRTPGTPSGVALILVSEAGENSIGVAPGANGCLTAQDIGKARRAFERAEVVLVQLETPIESVSATIELAHELGKRIILNPAPAAELPLELLRRVSILTPNETEAELLSGMKVADSLSAERAGMELQRRGIETVIVTCGAEGAVILTGGVPIWVPPRKVTPVDTTAAGDVFNGSLAVALGSGKSLTDAVRFANAAASISVTRQGAQPSAPFRREIEELLGREN